MTPNLNIAKEAWCPHGFRNAGCCPDCRPSQPVGEKLEALTSLTVDGFGISCADATWLLSHTANLEARVAELEQFAKDATADCIKESAAKARAELRVAELEGALKEYGAHLPDCAFDPPDTDHGCTCGFHAALKVSP